MTIRYKCINQQCFMYGEEVERSGEEYRCHSCVQKLKKTPLQPFTRITWAGLIDHINVTENEARDAAAKGMKLFQSHLEAVKGESK